MREGDRLRVLADTLAGEALPTPVLLERVNRALRKAGQRPIKARRLDAWLDRLLEVVPTGRLRRLTRKQLALEREIPAEFAQHRIFYCLSGEVDYRIVDPQTVVISDDEALALEVARGVLSGGTTKDRGTDAPQDADNPLAAALDNLIRRFAVADKLSRAPADPVIVDNFALEDYDPKHLQVAMRAIRLGQGLRLTYEPPGEEPREMIVIPVQLVLSNGEWRLAAWIASKVQILKIARMRTMTQCRSPAKPVDPAEDAISSRLAEAFRATMDCKRARVVLRFTRRAWGFVRDRRWGSKQTVKFHDDGLDWTPSEKEVQGAIDEAMNKGEMTSSTGTLIVMTQMRGPAEEESYCHELSFVTTGLDAVRYWVLQFGAHVHVVEPVSLRAWVAEQVGVAYVEHRDADPERFPPLKKSLTRINPPADHHRRALPLG